MRKLLAVFGATTLFLTGCNFLDWAEPSSNHFDRCKALADNGDYEGAIVECNLADPDSVDVNVQTELGDIYLSSVGISLRELKPMFQTAGGNTALIVELANSIIENNGAVTDLEVEHAVNAIDSFDVGGNIFAQAISRIALVAVLIAQTDSDGVGSATYEGNGVIDEEDVCGVANCASICIEGVTDTSCDGMDGTSAGVAYTILLDVIGTVSSLVSDGIQVDPVEAILATPIPNPATLGVGTITIGDAAGDTADDAARALFYKIVKDYNATN